MKKKISSNAKKGEKLCNIWLCFSHTLAEIDRPWKFDHKVKRPITINEVIDTNLPQYSVQPGGTEHKDVGCLCCTAGPLEMKGKLYHSNSFFCWGMVSG